MKKCMGKDMARNSALVRFHTPRLTRFVDMVGRFAILCAIVGTPSVNAGGDPCVTAGVANVSCFGWSATDATDVVQAALDSTASTVYLDDPRGYVARPLTVTQSHKRVVLRPGVILAAKPGAFHGGSDTLLTVGFFKAG